MAGGKMLSPSTAVDSSFWSIRPATAVESAGNVPWSDIQEGLGPSGTKNRMAWAIRADRAPCPAALQSLASETRLASLPAPVPVSGCAPARHDLHNRPMQIGADLLTAQSFTDILATRRSNVADAIAQKQSHRTASRIKPSHGVPASDPARRGDFLRLGFIRSKDL